MIVLAFDTALAACSVALYDDKCDAILAARHEAVTRGHAELLPGMIQTVMTESGLAMNAIDRIVTTRGPGTFTGVRIGLAAARGLALALHRSACGISTLEALAVAAQLTNAVALASVIDARRGEVYAQVFAADGSALDDARLVTIETAARQIPEGIAVVGSGAALLIAAGHLGPMLPVDPMPDAAAFVRRAARLIPKDAPPEPLYLRAPDAKAQARVVSTALGPVSVIEAGPAHAAVLARLHAAAYERPWTATEIAILLQRPGAVALFAMLGEGQSEPAGFVLAQSAADEAEILTICTRPAARRCGVAQRLMTTLAKRLAQEGTGSLFLEVDGDNEPALGLYRNLGFTVVGRRPAYYLSSAGHGDALVMRQQLQSG